VQEFLNMMKEQGPLAKMAGGANSSGKLAKSRQVSRRAKAKSLLGSMFSKSSGKST